MDANQLLFYLRGFFEHIHEPTQAHIEALRNEVLRAQPVEVQILPVEVVSPMKQVISSSRSDGPYIPSRAPCPDNR